MRSWRFPLLILANASALMWLLTPKEVSLHLYLVAFTLWIFATALCCHTSELLNLR